MTGSRLYRWQCLLVCRSVCLQNILKIEKSRFCDYIVSACATVPIVYFFNGRTCFKKSSSMVSQISADTLLGVPQKPTASIRNKSTWIKFVITLYIAYSFFFAEILLPAWNPTGQLMPTCHHNFYGWSGSRFCGINTCFFAKLSPSPSSNPNWGLRWLYFQLLQSDRQAIQNSTF